MTAIKASHTPGPWTMNDWPQSGSDITVGANGTPKIAIIPLRDVSINEQQANARLIAAAPEMLAMLATVASYCRTMIETRTVAGESWMRDLRTLLARIDDQE